jgi:DNA-binding NarL/FixJ family response regulator
MNGIDRTQRSFGQNSSAAGETIVLAGNVSLWRDCFAVSLELEGYAVLPFPTVASWHAVQSKYPAPSFVVICEPRQSELSLVARFVKNHVTIVIADSEIGANVAVLLNDGERGHSSNGTTLTTALHAGRLVQSGGTFVSPELLSNGEHRTEFGGLLTQRQIDVVEALRQGKANKEIARDLNLRESTVKVHIRQIMRKLDAKNRTEIAVLANELREISRNSDHEEQG